MSSITGMVELKADSLETRWTCWRQRLVFSLPSSLGKRLEGTYADSSPQIFWGA